MVVWFHGGGYIFGNKNQFGSPIGLIDAARKLEGNIIWVSLRSWRKTMLPFPQIHFADNARSGLITGSEHLVGFLHRDSSRKGVRQMWASKIRSWLWNGSRTTSQALAEILPGLLLWENRPELLPSSITSYPMVVPTAGKLHQSSKERFFKVRLSFHRPMIIKEKLSTIRSSAKQGLHH